MSRATAPSRRPSSSRRGLLAHQERAGAPLALRGSEFDPTGFHLDAAQHAWQNDACSSDLVRLGCGDTHAQSSGQGPGVVVRIVFEEGCPGCKSGVWLTLGPKTCSLVIEITTYLILVLIKYV